MEAQQNELFHEDFKDALKHVVSALGGPKKVGHELWPSKTVDEARTRMNNSLDVNRAEKLDDTEIIWLLTQARSKGIHSAMAFLCRECGYADPHPIEPEDEAAELQRQFIASQQAMNQILRRMEKLSLPMADSVSR